MNLWLSRAGVFVAVLASSLGVARACGIDWQVPTNHFDGVNELGKLSYWREIGEVDLGDNLNIPLILGFNPTRRNSSACGSGWFVGPMDANLVQIDERKFLLTQPDGITRQCWRNVPTDTILHGQGEWQGEIKENTVTLWAKCGWKLMFSSGRISSITTPKNRILNFVYGNGGKISEVQEGGRTVLQVGVDENGNINGLTYGNRHVGMDLGERPRVDVIKGVNVVGGMEQSLHGVTMADGAREIYAFAVDDKIQPTLTISGDANRSFTWNPATGQAVKDGEWTYNIIPDSDRYKNARIGRANSQKQSEYWFYDGAHGQETSQDASGLKTVKTWFTSGMMAGRLRKIEQSNSGKPAATRQFAYDEKGRLARVTSTQPSGAHAIVGYHYTDKGADVIQYLPDGTRTIDYDSGGRIEDIVFGGGRVASIQQLLQHLRQEAVSTK